MSVCLILLFKSSLCALGAAALKAAGQVQRATSNLGGPSTIAEACQRHIFKVL